MDTEIMNRKIKCGFINIQSMGNKTHEINELIIYRKFDILALAETWLSEYDKAKICEMITSKHINISSKDRKVGVEFGFLYQTRSRK